MPEDKPCELLDWCVRGDAHGGPCLAGDGDAAWAVMARERDAAEIMAGNLRKTLILAEEALAQVSDDRDTQAEALGVLLALPVGTRVRHIDQMPPVDGRLLPMHGRVVAIEMHYIVEWDRPASDSPLPFGEQATFKYPAEVLAAETPEEEMNG